MIRGENDGSRVAVLLKAVQEGQLSRAVLQRNAKRSLRLCKKEVFKDSLLNGVGCDTALE